jgi:hypothetical protein
MSNQNITTSYTDVMIDIETTSTQNNACILSIGVVAFNLYNISLSGESEDKKLELLIDKKSCDEIGLHTCPDTMKWWSNQSISVKKRAFEDGPRISIKDALLKLSEFCKKYKFKRYWAQGINFDYIVLENAYSYCGLKEYITWKFYQLRDSRTVRFLVDVVPEKPKDAHDAIADCKYQIEMIQYVYIKLGLIKNEVKSEELNNDKKEEIKKEEIKKEKKRVLLKPGDWCCKECQSINFSYRGDCYNCGFVNNEELKSKQKNDWICGGCQTTNFSYRKKCYKCAMVNSTSESTI